jgi:anti-anti-sigma factor
LSVLAATPEATVTTSTISTRAYSRTVVITLRGHIDEKVSHRLRHLLVDAIMRRRTRRIVIDLAEATQPDATALGALIAAHDSAPEMQIAFDLRRPSPAMATHLASHGLTAAPGGRQLTPPW